MDRLDSGPPHRNASLGKWLHAFPFLLTEDPVTRDPIFACGGPGYTDSRFCMEIPRLHGVSFLLSGWQAPQIAGRVRSARAEHDPLAGASPVPFAGTTRRFGRSVVLCTAPLVSSFGCGAGPVASLTGRAGRWLVRLGSSLPIKTV